jgi:hypothetical protein
MWSALGAVLLTAGCGHSGGGPYLSASWTGSDTGRIAARAVASWCPVANRLEVKAVQEDVGFALAIYPEKDLASGEFPVFDPGIDTVHRPGAAGVTRWFTEKQLQGYQSDSGGVTLARSGDKLQLQFRLRMRSLGGEGTIRATGRATGLVPGSCPADSVPNASPRQ